MPDKSTARIMLFSFRSVRVPILFEIEAPAFGAEPQLGVAAASVCLSLDLDLHFISLMDTLL